jgi:hypothetical protein
MTLVALLFILIMNTFGMLFAVFMVGEPCKPLTRKSSRTILASQLVYSAAAVYLYVR